MNTTIPIPTDSTMTRPVRQVQPSFLGYLNHSFLSRPSVVSLIRFPIYWSLPCLSSSWLPVALSEYYLSLHRDWYHSIQSKAIDVWWEWIQLRGQRGYRILEKFEWMIEVMIKLLSSHRWIVTRCMIAIGSGTFSDEKLVDGAVNLIWTFKHTADWTSAEVDSISCWVEIRSVWSPPKTSWTPSKWWENVEDKSEWDDVASSQTNINHMLVLATRSWNL